MIRREQVVKRILVLALVLAAGAALGQIQPIPEMPITANGEFGVGFAGGSGSVDAANTSTGNNNEVYVVTDVTANGFYHDPRFLQFSVAPNFRWSRASQDTQVLRDGNEGLNANVQFLGGSFMPISLQYNLSRLTTTTLAGGLTPLSVASSGLNQTFTASAVLNRLHWPGLTLTLNKGSGDSTISGTDYHTNSNQFGYGANLTYMLLGFRMNGNYHHTEAEQNIPDLLNLGTPMQSTLHEDTETVGLGRNLPLSSDLNLNYSHTHSHDFYSSLDNAFGYDTASGFWNAHPTKRLSLSADILYNSNVGAQLLSQALTGAVTATAPQFLSYGHENTYGGNAGYSIGHGFQVTANASHSDATLNGEDLTFNAYGAGLLYSHMVWGGKLTAMYTPQYYHTEQTVNDYQARLSGLMNTGQLAYMHRVGRWMGSGTFIYSQTNSSSTTFIPVVRHSVSGNANLNTRLAHEWSFSLGTYLSDSSYAGTNGSFGFTGYGSISNRTWSLTVQDQFGRGYLVATPVGLVPSPTPTVPTLNTYYSISNGITASGTYTRRRLSLTAAFTHNGANVDTFTLPVDSSNTSLDTRLTYRFRKLDVRGGYRRWSQFASSNGGLNQSYQTYWIEVVRSFHLF